MRVRSLDHSGRQIGIGYLEMTGYTPISIFNFNAIQS